MTEFIILGIAATLAGLVDAVVGGGGLIQTPMLFSVFPQTNPATLLGTGKLAGVWGTAASALSYAKKVQIRWATVFPAALSAFLFSFCGAFTVTHIPSDFVRKLLPFILVLVASYTLMRKDFGMHHSPIYDGRREFIFALLAGGVIGFYDGFFGPGTGSFLVFLFVRFFGFDFLSASASAKLVNVACNLSALLWFGYSGHVFWLMGAVMAICNVMGSLIGSRLAIKYGSGFVRKAFLFVVSALILKSTYDAFLK